MVLRAMGVALIVSLILTGIGGALVVTNGLGLLYGFVFASFDAAIRSFFGPLDPWKAVVLALAGLPVLCVGRILIARCLRAITVFEIGMIDTAAWPAAETQLQGLAKKRSRSERLARKADRRRLASGARAGGILIT